jgi:hypothetical protein
MLQFTCMFSAIASFYVDKNILNKGVVPSISLWLYALLLFIKVKKEKCVYSLCLINKASRREHVWRNESIAPPFLTSALSGG